MNVKGLLNKVTNLFFRYFNILFAVLIAAMYANALIFPNMGLDASFYLRVTEYIADGVIPEYDLRILYPPLVFYMLVPVNLLVGDTIAYEIYLGYMFLFQILNAFFIYKISERYSSNHFIRVFSALMYLFLSIKLEGEFLVLEPFVNFWGLLTALIYIKFAKEKHVYIFLAGILAFFAFLVKQYGLAYAGLLYLLILSDHYKQVRKMIIMGLIFTSGLLAGLTLFILVFKIIYGIHYDFFAGGRLALYGEKNTSRWLLGTFNIIEIAPYIIFIAVPKIFKKIVNSDLHIFAYLMLVVLFSIQLYFQQYLHYYILMLPGLILMGVIMFDQYISFYKLRLFVIILVSLFISAVFIEPGTSSLVFSKQSNVEKEIKTAKKINQIIPEGTPVYLFANVKLYYLCHFEPVIPEKYGFAWGHMISLENLDEILFCTNYVITDQSNLKEEYQLLDTMISLYPILQEHNFKVMDNVEDYIVFTKPL